MGYVIDARRRTVRSLFVRSAYAAAARGAKRRQQRLPIERQELGRAYSRLSCRPPRKGQHGSYSGAKNRSASGAVPARRGVMPPCAKAARQSVRREKMPYSVVRCRSGARGAVRAQCARYVAAVRVCAAGKMRARRRAARTAAMALRNA